MHVSTRLIHADEPHRPPHALAPPIAQPTNAAIPTAEEFAETAVTPLHPDFYNRHGNANHEQASAILAELEGAERGMLTSAGMGAATTAFLALLSAGDHVIGQRSIYAGVSSWMLNLLPRFGIEVTIVDQTDTRAFADAFRPNTALVLLETPSNPRLEIPTCERSRPSRSSTGPRRCATTPSPPRSTSGRSTTASTWSGTAPRSISAATPT
jgi:cystathionine beta-lyase/cystathionine gamma-synthase